jgi:hypothetical protein
VASQSESDAAVIAEQRVGMGMAPARRVAVNPPPGLAPTPWHDLCEGGGPRRRTWPEPQAHATTKQVDRLLSNHPDAHRLLITADCGGSNGARVRLWKRELQLLANELGLTITVCHLPPGTSKWNKIDPNTYPAGVKVSDADMAALNLTPHKLHGEWNYTIAPRLP